MEFLNGVDMPYINFHAHSTVTDGVSSMEEIVKESIDLDFCCAIITDHIFSSSTEAFNLTRTDFNKQLEEAKQLESKYNFPVIIGAEVAISGSEEIIVFGVETIRQILKLRDRYNSILFNDLIAIKAVTDCCYLLAHPMRIAKLIRQKFIYYLDGYEHIHSGTIIPGVEQFKRYPMVGICSSDAHSSEYLGRCYNEIEDNISNEIELIHYIKTQKPIKHIINTEYYDKKKVLENIKW